MGTGRVNKRDRLPGSMRALILARCHSAQGAKGMNEPPTQAIVIHNCVGNEFEIRELLSHSDK